MLTCLFINKHFFTVINSQQKIDAIPFNRPQLNEQKIYIGVLDLLRGIAALSVVFYHFTANNLLAKFESSTMDNLCSRGYLGVEIFFVISGFVIPYSLWNTDYNPTSIISFLRKRITRIFPPAYVSLILTLLQWAIIDYIHPEKISHFANLTAVALLRNLTFSYGFINPSWINGVFWTLGIEIQFYIFIGLFFNIIFKKSTPLNLIIFFSLITAGYFFIDKSDHGTFAFTPLFALGGLILFYKKERIKLPFFFLTTVLFTTLSFFTLGLYSSLIGLATAYAIAFINIRNNFFKLLGQISYSLYLTHILVGSSADFLFSKFIHPTTEAGNICVILLFVLLACIFAYIFTKTVEEPFLRLAKRLKI